MENQTVLYEQSGNIVTITYNRPNKQNAINGQMRKELNDACLLYTSPSPRDS